MVTFAKIGKILIRSYFSAFFSYLCTTQALIIMTIKALFFDIDGTLVSFQTHRIPQSTVRALTLAKAAGTRIYISTGRPVPFITNIGQIEHLVHGYITSNGAYCFVGSETVSCHDMATADVHRILRSCDTYRRPAVVVGTRNIAVYRNEPVIDEVFRRGLGLGDFRFAPLEQVMAEPVLQVTPFLTPAQEAELMRELPQCTSGRWTEAFTDITHRAADKGQALLAVAAHEHIDLAHTMAFGDGGNDISILRAAGIGVAMGNADEQTQRSADFVTTSVDHDGIRNALLHYGVISE